MKKGFATSAILYTILLLFLVLMTGILNNLQNKKTILDALKKDTVSALEQDTVIDAILDQIGMINTNFVDLEKRVTNLENIIQESTNINRDYVASFVFGNLQTGYAISNSFAIGDMRNKKVTVTRAVIEGIAILDATEMDILSRYTSKNKDGFFFYVADRNNTDVQHLASKIAGYSVNIYFIIGDM